MNEFDELDDPYEDEDPYERLENMSPREVDDFHSYLDDLVRSNRLDKTAAGITKQVIGKGYNSLTETQRRIFKKYVWDTYTTSCCKICRHEVEWSDMQYVLDNDNVCCECQHMFNKMDKW